MENAVEALKIAFAVLMFVMALSLGISSISNANNAVNSIISLNDRETDYSYVTPTGYSRTVGVETIVPILYKAYQENFEVRFYKKNGDPLAIYYATDSNGDRKIDANKNEIEVNSIDGSEVFGSTEEAISHLNQILGPMKDVSVKYKKQICHDDGFYKFLSDKKFKEELGEYYQNDSENTPEANKVKKRVITYTLQ